MLQIGQMSSRAAKREQARREAEFQPRLEVWEATNGWRTVAKLSHLIHPERLCWIYLQRFGGEIANGMGPQLRQVYEPHQIGDDPTVVDEPHLMARAILGGGMGPGQRVIVGVEVTDSLFRTHKWRHSLADADFMASYTATS